MNLLFFYALKGRKEVALSPYRKTPEADDDPVICWACKEKNEAGSEYCVRCCSALNGRFRSACGVCGKPMQFGFCQESGCPAAKK